jgi:hypothetical protein
MRRIVVGLQVVGLQVALLALASQAAASAPDAPDSLRVKPAVGGAQTSRGDARSARAAGALAPSTTTGWAGVRDPNTAPPDTVGAVGDSRFVALVNRKFAIYDKASTSPIKTGTLNEFAGVPATNSTTHPQIIWDPQTSRFYYLMLTIPVTDPPNDDNRLAFGFSTTATPNNAADFCHYQIAGYEDQQIPDLPKLGDSRYFLLMAVSAFHPDFGYIRGDSIAITKPPSGPTCPDPTSFGITFVPDLLNPDFTQTYTPVPVNSVDTADAGWMIATPNSRPANSFTFFKVTRNPDGTASIQNPGSSRRVPSYDVPADAPQKNSANLLDTLDGRLTQAVSAIDPSQGGKQAVWIQHTVAGGAGAELRWYEFNLSGSGLLQSGKVTSPSIFNFNGAISPDRAVTGASTQFGNGMVLGYSSSSPSLFPQIRMVSKVGAAPQSGPVVAKASTTFYSGPDCSGGLCSWGGYAAATPDPTPTGSSPQVWLTNEFAFTPSSPTAAGWKPWNWIAVP